MTTYDPYPVRSYFHLLLLLLTGLFGCRETVLGPDDPVPDFSPNVVGEFTGTFEGALGLIGVPDSTIRDTFQLNIDIRRIDADFGYRGNVLRGGSDPVYLYDCGTGVLFVSNDRRVQIDCIQRNQADSVLVFRLNAQFDPEYGSLEGVVHEISGVGEEEYRIELTRTGGGK